MDCNCHEVLGGEADDAGVDTDGHVAFFVVDRVQWVAQCGDVKLIVDHKATVIGTFAVVVGVKVGHNVAAAVGVVLENTRGHQSSVIAEH